MFAVKAYYDGTVFVPLTPVNAKKNQTAIITILDESPIKSQKPFEKFIGRLSVESYAEITEALKDTQRVDGDEW